MKTIIFIVNQLRKSGPIEILFDLITNLNRSLFIPIIIRMMKDDPDRSITSAFEEIGVEVFKLSYSFIDLELRTNKIANDLDRLLAKHQVDLIHTHGYHPVLIASKMKTVCPKIETMHCICSEDFISSKGWVLGKYMNWRYLRCLNNMNQGIAISDTGKLFYSNLINNFNVQRIYNGVNTKKFNNTDRYSKNEWRKKLGLPENIRIFLVVGTIRKVKDPETVIKAFLNINTKIRENCILLFLGKGPLLYHCQQLAQNCPSIIFKGYTFNVHEYLHAADYTICASRSEGFGLAYIESLMAGVAVISTNIGPFKEFSANYPLLQQLQFQGGDVEALKSKIEYAFNTNINMSNITDETQKKFSTQRMSMEYMELYHKLIK